MSMENITLGQIAAAIGLIGVIYGGYKALSKNIREGIEKCVADLLKPITNSIDQINDRLDRVDMESTKNFLVRCLSDVEKGEKMTETEAERFWEQYEHYVTAGGNTYIKNKVEDLRKQGKI